MTTRLALAVPLGLCLCSVRAPSVQGALEQRCAALEHALPGMLERAEAAGISLAVADAEGLRWTAQAGVRDRASGTPVDADTVFEAASLSKPVFAYAVLQLVDEDLLELDRPLIEYAEHDELADVAHDPRHARLTARLLLDHAGGLPNWRPNGGKLEFESDPGTKWRYSGEGFVLLQRIVEARVGASLEELARNLVFEPLGMERTSYVWNPAFAANVAFPHDETGTSRPSRQLTEPNAAYSLLTTASDYARFLSALMRGEGLDEATRRELLEPQVAVDPGVAWGLGVGLEEHADGHAFWHWGHNGGYRAYTVTYPARDLALVWFTNSDHGMRLLRDLAERLTGETSHPAIDHLDYEGYPEPGTELDGER